MLADVPENREDGCFALQEYERTGFADQPGDFVAVYQKKVVGSDHDETTLRERLAKDLSISPDRFFLSSTKGKKC